MVLVSPRLTGPLSLSLVLVSLCLSLGRSCFLLALLSLPLLLLLVIRELRHLAVARLGATAIGETGGGEEGGVGDLFIVEIGGISGPSTLFNDRR
jgi:hypothetical protein